MTTPQQTKLDLSNIQTYNRNVTWTQEKKEAIAKAIENAAKSVKTVHMAQVMKKLINISTGQLINKNKSASQGRRLASVLKGKRNSA